jgi:hypothetical protein
MVFTRHTFHKDVVSFADWPTVSGRTPAYRWSNHRDTVDSQSRDRLILKNEKYILPYHIYGSVTGKELRVPQQTRFGRRNAGTSFCPSILIWLCQSSLFKFYIFIHMSTRGQKIYPSEAIVPTETVLPCSKKKREEEENCYSVSSINLTHSIEAPIFLIWNYLYLIRRFWAQNPSPKCFINYLSLIIFEEDRMKESLKHMVPCNKIASNKHVCSVFNIMSLRILWSYGQRGMISVWTVQTNITSRCFWRLCELWTKH